MADHEMRPECAVEFGKIQTALEFHKEWRDESRNTLSCIKKEVEKLTGNGNRGRIDSIADQLTDIHKLLAVHLKESEARDKRLDEQSDRIDELDRRLFKVAVGAAALAALLAPVIEMLITKYL